MNWSRTVCLAVMIFHFPPVALTQQKKTQQTHPAPQITGRLIGTDGKRELIVEYKTASGTGTFFGNIHSTCMLPAKPNLSEASALELSSFPLGSQVTLFYVQHETKRTGSAKQENVVMAVRFDKLNGASNIPVGKSIPCFRGPHPAGTK